MLQADAIRQGNVMGRFLITAIVVAAIVIGVLYFTGYDLFGQVTGKATSARGLDPASPNVSMNVVAGVVSGLIVAFLTSAFSRR
jgi:hypothetical protein